MNEIPEDAPFEVVTLFKETDQPEVGKLAEMEAMMTYMKITTENENAHKIVILDPSIAEDKDKLFHFARIFQNTLLGLIQGAIKVPKQIQDMFNEMPLRE